ncbi:MAG: hypothetical protein HKN63_06135 [Rhodobacteraceae bacterium]|nr:hypothetical protein [Paracoccaceae bacterium]
MKLTITAAAVAISIALPGFAGTLNDTYTSYYAFGDSLVDDGKLEPFFDFASISLDGRFSNGQTWAELVAADFDGGEQTLNLGIGGATANGPDIGAAAGPLRLTTFAGQVGTFTEALGLGGIVSGDNPLVSVIFGANDIFQELDTVAPDINVAFAAADAVAAGILQLASLGSSQLDDFLVSNLPDIGATPSFTTFLGDPDGVGPGAAAATAFTDAFNFQLGLNLIALTDGGLNITVLDLNGIFADVVAGNTDGALSALAGLDVVNACTISIRSQDFPVCDDPNLTFFVDGVHPNALAHEAIAGIAVDQLAPVPLPAGLPLGLTALAALGFLGRRRAA